jgi:hypothetical protein
VTAGAGAGAVTTRARRAGASDREGAGRRGVGFARRGGRGAVTVTSGSVSDTCPEAGPGEVSSPENVNAPKATAPNSRGFKTCSGDGPRLVPNAPSIVAPTQHQISPSQVQPINDFLPPELLSNLVGNFVQCLREYTAASRRPLLPLIQTNLLNIMRLER